MPQRIPRKVKEVRCPMNHPYTRDNGKCCFGGTHFIDGTNKDIAAAEQEVRYADGKTAKSAKAIALVQDGCKHGYQYNREEGRRCKGGSHYVHAPADEKFTHTTVWGSGAVARHNVKYSAGKCKVGFTFDRDEGQRCSGGSHYVDVPQDEKYGVDTTKGDGTLKGQWWKKGAPECQHGYRYSREDGTRCEGGSHHFADGHYDPSIHGPNAGQPKKFPLPRECPDGYKFEREHGTRCKGGSHFRYYE